MLVTGDHLVMLADGSFKAVRDLGVGAWLRKLGPVTITLEDQTGNQVYDIQVRRDGFFDNDGIIRNDIPE